LSPRGSHRTPGLLGRGFASRELLRKLSCLHLLDRIGHQRVKPAAREAANFRSPAHPVAPPRNIGPEFKRRRLGRHPTKRRADRLVLV
jgi:hypothetical protein